METVKFRSRPTPLFAVIALTFMASIGTGVLWSGIAFIVKHEYHYEKPETLGLYVFLGVVYVVGARTAGFVLRRVHHLLNPRAAIVILMLAGAAVCLGPLLVRSTWMLLLVTVVLTIQQSWLWPIVESYLSSGRHGTELRRAIGWWNIWWTFAITIALFIMAPTLETNARITFGIIGVVYLVSLFSLFWFPSSPAAHDEESSRVSVQPEYSQLLHAARILLPLSYILNSAMSPLLPYLFDRLEVSVFWETPAAATWTMARTLAVIMMWRIKFWHGRWGTLLIGGIVMTIGFALIVTGFSLALMLVGLAMLGVGMGIVYYAALYYAMSVGRATVEAGGIHEALIGLGYAIGPAAGFVGLGASRLARSQGWEVWEGSGVVVTVWLLIAIGGVAAVKPYFTARNVRTNDADCGD